MEGLFEEESQLRRCMENELLAEPNISPEQALKVQRCMQKDNKQVASLKKIGFDLVVFPKNNSHIQ